MYLAIDVGGTNTRLELFSNLTPDAKISHKHFNTPKNPKQLSLIINNFLKKLKVKNIKAAILGLPGVLDKNKETLIKSPNLNKAWINVSFKKIFRNIVKEIYCQNDAALAALGEAILGAGRNYSIVAYITISTGIGGARVINGNLDENFSGFEPGHHIIILQGRLCSCGQKGCFQAYASGKGFRNIFHKEPKKCSNQDYWNQYAKFLGQGLINVILFWSPEVLILGGSMLNKPIYFWQPLKYFLKKNLKIIALPTIKISELKDEAGTLGGIMYLKNLLQK